jgi:hypothetical protein
MANHSERMKKQMLRWQIIGELRKQNITFYNTPNFFQMVNALMEQRAF